MPAGTSVQNIYNPNTNPDVAVSVQQLVNSGLSTAQLCNELQKLGPEYQADIRTLVRENHELQVILGVNTEPQSDELATGMEQVTWLLEVMMADDLEDKIERSSWLLSLLIVDAQEGYGGANERLQKGLERHQVLLREPMRNQSEIEAKEKALQQLRAYLDNGMFHHEHRHVVQLFLNQLDHKAVAASSDVLVNSNKLTLIDRVEPKGVGVPLVASPLKLAVAAYFDKVTPDVLYKLDCAEDNFNSAIGFAEIGYKQSARYTLEAAMQKLNACVTEHDRELFSTWGLMKDFLEVPTYYVEKLNVLWPKIVNLPEENMRPLERAIKHYGISVIAKNAAKDVVDLVNRIYSEKKMHFSPVQNGSYPFRDSVGRPNLLMYIAPVSGNGLYQCESLSPFIDLQKTTVERQALYDEYLECRQITEKDCRHPNEKDLIGQNAVVAKKAISAGQCLGVYGGEIKHADDARDDTYTLYVAHPRKEMVIEGDNILSRLNTVYQYDESGIPCAQADSGYNVEFVSFAGELQHPIAGGQQIIVTAVFALTDIPANQELRVSYGYDAGMIKKTLSGQVIDWDELSATPSFPEPAYY